LTYSELCAKMTEDCKRVAELESRLGLLRSARELDMDVDVVEGTLKFFDLQSDKKWTVEITYPDARGYAVEIICTSWRGDSRVRFELLHRRVFVEFSPIQHGRYLIYESRIPLCGLKKVTSEGGGVECIFATDKLVIYPRGYMSLFDLFGNWKY
ncbi:MAG: hypothetical protein WAP23_00465, partial [Candidatus Spechtbacterales bacterium]